MTIPVFPALPGLTFSTHKRPVFATLEQVAASGRAVRMPQRVYPLWEFELRFEFLRDQTQNADPFVVFAGRQDLQVLLGLFLAMSGKYGQFYYSDPSDNSRAGQALGTATSGQTQFTLVRTFGLPSMGLTEPVGGVDQIAAVYLDGVPLSPVMYSAMGNLLTFTFGLTAGTAVTIDYSFYYLCHFIDDTDFEQFMKNIWTLQSLKFRSEKTA